MCQKTEDNKKSVWTKMQNVQTLLRDEKIMSISMIGEAAGRGVINLRMGRGKIASTLTFINWRDHLHVLKCQGPLITEQDYIHCCLFLTFRISLNCWKYYAKSRVREQGKKTEKISLRNSGHLPTAKIVGSMVLKHENQSSFFSL